MQPDATFVSDLSICHSCLCVLSHLLAFVHWLSINMLLELLVYVMYTLLFIFSREPVQVFGKVGKVKKNKNATPFFFFK